MSRYTRDLCQDIPGTFGLVDISPREIKEYLQSGKPRTLSFLPTAGRISAASDEAM
jgi:hypothetical protein